VANRFGAKVAIALGANVVNEQRAIGQDRLKPDVAVRLGPKDGIVLRCNGVNGINGYRRIGTFRLKAEVADSLGAKVGIALGAIDVGR